MKASNHAFRYRSCLLPSEYLHVQIRITQTLWFREEEFLCLIKLTFDSYGSSFEPESPSLEDKSCEHRKCWFTCIDIYFLFLGTFNIEYVHRNSTRHQSIQWKLRHQP